MKSLLTAAALIVLTGAASAQPLNRTQEYRMWSAEQMIGHLVNRFARTTAACGQAQIKAVAPTASEVCRAAVINAYPMLNTIREVAASGDTVQWANMMDAIRTLEKDTEAPLYALERK